MCAVLSPPIRARLPEQIPSSQSARFLSRRTLPEVAGRSRTRHHQGRPLPALAPHPDLISNPRKAQAGARPRTLCRHRSITSRHWRSPRRRRLLYDCQLDNPQNPLERLNTQSCSIRARRPLAHVQGESLKAGGATLCTFPGARSCIPWNAAQSMSHLRLWDFPWEIHNRRYNLLILRCTVRKLTPPLAV